jgi:hypothetical protein
MRQFHDYLVNGTEMETAGYPIVTRVGAERIGNTVSISSSRVQSGLC